MIINCEEYPSFDVENDGYVVFKGTSDLIQIYTYKKTNSAGIFNVVFNPDLKTISFELNYGSLDRYRLNNGQFVYFNTAFSTGVSTLSSMPAFEIKDILATSVDIKNQNGQIIYLADFGFGCKDNIEYDHSNLIYVPDVNDYSCVYLRDKDTLRAYYEAPANNKTVSYRDYYINSHYLYNDGNQSFSNYSTLPSCLDRGNLTDSIFYRTDFASIFLVFVLFVFFIFGCVKFVFKPFFLSRSIWRR